MREGWKITKLGAISEIFRGGSPRPIKSFITQEADGVNWIKIGDTEVGGKYIYSTEEKIRREGMRSSRYVEPGDFLLSNSMSFGRPYILKTDGCIHDGWLVIKKYDRTLIQDFLYYLLLSPVVARQFEEGARGSTVRNLNTDIVSNVVVSYPVSHIEQQRIVDILDREFAKIDALKANAEESLPAAKDLFQATMKKELEPKVGWEKKQITEIASLKAGKFVSAQDIFDERKDGMYPCFGGNGLRGYVKTYNHDGRYNIIGRQGALCGNINIAEGKFHATEHAVVVSPIIPIVFKFLYYSLLNANINQFATGAAQPGISVKNINERLFLAIPSLEEQERVAARLDKVKQLSEDLQHNYQNTLTLCDDLKQSLLRKAFNGEL